MPLQVIDAIEFILPLVFLSEIGDGLNGVCGGKHSLFQPIYCCRLIAVWGKALKLCPESRRILPVVISRECLLLALHCFVLIVKLQGITHGFASVSCVR